MSCMGQLFASDAKVAQVSEQAPLKPADLKRMRLREFLNSERFKVDMVAIGNKCGYIDEAERLMHESNFKGHMTVAKEELARYLSVRGCQVPVQQNPGVGYAELLVHQEERQLQKLQKHFYDKDGYPKEEYFWKLVRHHEGRQKNPNIAWYLEKSWKK